MNKVEQQVKDFQEELSNEKKLNLELRKLINKTHIERERAYEDLAMIYKFKKTDIRKQFQDVKKQVEKELKSIRDIKITKITKQIEIIENAEHIEILKNPKLKEKLLKEIDKKVVNERDTCWTIIVFKCGELVKNANKTSFNLFLSDVSGVGKDYVTTNTLKLFPRETTIKRTKTTPELLAYWHNSKFEPEWTWDGKSLYLEEISRNVLDSEVFLTFVSGEGRATVLIKQTPVDIIVKGKPVMFVTSATKSLKSDQLRRFAVCECDSSIDQSKAIMKRQSQLASAGINPSYNENIMTSLRYLKKVKVKIPFAPAFYESLCNKIKIHTIVRSVYQRLLDIIKAVAALYQKQRLIDDDGQIIATLEDYEMALPVFKKILSNASVIPLTKQKKEVLEIVKKLSIQSKNGWVTLKEIEPKSPVSRKTLLGYLRHLASEEFLLSERMEFLDKNGASYFAAAYLPQTIDALELPTVKELQKEVKKC